jgi:RNA polymerase sigma factor for flagellar operon FliA
MVLAEVDLVRQGLPVVQMVARRIARRLGGHVHLDDLLSIGNLALMEAARDYEPGRATFAAYAASKLKWAILDGLRRETHGRSTAARVLAVMASERFAEAEETRSPSDEPTTLEQDRESLTCLLEGQAAAMALGLLATAHDPTVGPAPAPNPEEALVTAEIHHVAQRAVAALPDRERALVERHYFGGEQFDAIARDLGISKSWACRLHERAIGTLGGAMRGRRRRAPATCDRAP